MFLTVTFIKVKKLQIEVHELYSVFKFEFNSSETNLKKERKVVKTVISQILSTIKLSGSNHSHAKYN